MTATKEQFFKPGKVSAQEKASATDQAAREIISAEANRRNEKTERLRQLRQAQEADVIPVLPVRRKKSATSKK